MKKTRRTMVSVYGTFFLFFFLILLIYFNAIAGSFVSDDINAILKNPSVGSFSTIVHVGFFSYIQPFIYFVLFRVFGRNPIPFHLVNIFFHFGSVCILYMILRKLYSHSVAILSGLLFAVHPILTESVTWISGGNYVRAGFFFFFALYLYIKYVNQKHSGTLICAWASFMFSLMSSEKSIPLVIVFPLFIILWNKPRKYLLSSFSFIFITLPFLISNILRIPERIAVSHVAYLTGNSSSFPFMFAPQAIGEYLKLIVFPLQLTLYHATPNSVVNTGIFLVFVVLLLIAILTKKHIAFWMILFMVSLSVTLVSPQIAWVVAERYVYIGTAAIIVPLVFAYWYCVNSFRKLRSVWIFIPLILIALYSVRTVMRNRDWINEEVLWEATVAVSPNDFGVHNDLGMVYMQQNRLNDAISEFSESIRLNAKFPASFYHRGYAYMRTGNIDAAIQDLTIAISLDPKLGAAYQNMGALYYQMHNFKEAQYYSQKALMVDPENSALYSNLAVIYGETKQYAKAQQILEEALRINPHDTSAVEGLRIIKSMQSSQNATK